MGGLVESMKHKGLFWGIMGVSIVVGGVLVVLGMAMGGQLGNTNDIWDFDKNGNKNIVRMERSSKGDNGSSEDEFSNIKNLDFQLAAGDVTITEGDRFSVSGTSINSYISDDGQTWHLESPKPRKWYSWLYRRGGEWEITLPKNCQFDQVTFNFAAAEIDIAFISAEKLTIQGAAGEANIQHMIARKSVDLSIGAGSLEVENGELDGDSRIKCGAGSMDLSLSRLVGSMKADCGMGTIDLTLPGTRGQYNIASQAGMGQVNIEHNNEDHHQVGTEILADLDLTCGMGEIEVEFHD